MTKIIKTFLLAALSAMTAFASAANYYFSDCQSGAVGGCVVGSNGNAGTDPANPRLNTTGFTFTTGNSYYFARGASLSGLASIAPPSGTSTASRMVFGAYDHPSFSSANKPILTFSGNGINFNKSSHFEVANLKLVGPGNDINVKGIVLSNGSDVYVHDNEITAFGFGMHASDGDASARTTDFWITTNEIHHNRSMGFEGSADRLLIEYNNIHHNGTDGNGKDHNIYIGAVVFTNYSITVRNNTVTDNNPYTPSGLSEGVAIVAHGPIVGLAIEDNTIIDTVTNYGHYGIAVNGVTGGTTNPHNFRNLVIRGNKVVIVGKGTLGITWNSATNAIVENNLIIMLNTVDYGKGIAFDVDAATTSRGDVLGTNSMVRNNTIYMDFNTSSPAISLTAGITAGALGGGGDSLINNLVYIKCVNSTTLRAFDLKARALNTFVTIANELAFSPQTLQWSDLYSTLSASQAAGIDAGSLNADPLFTATPTSGNNYDVSVQAGSPAVDAGHSTKSSRTTYGRYLAAGVRRDIGGEERSKTTLAPVGPSNGRVQ